MKDIEVIDLNLDDLELTKEEIAEMEKADEGDGIGDDNGD